MSFPRPKPVVARRIERVHTFDLMRGLFLVVILLNHLAYYPSGLDILTGRSMLYVSAAEGFFLISGIVLGMVRGRKLLNRPFKDGALLLVKRSLQLYVEAIILTMIFTIIGWFWLDNPGLKYGIAEPGTPLLEILWRTMTLDYSYGWADFLRHYAVFLAGAPIVLWLLRRGLWHVASLGSIAIWLVYPLTPGGEKYIEISWQLIFYFGMIIGFYWPELTKFWRQHFSPRTRHRISFMLFLAFIVSAIASFIIVFGATFWQNPELTQLHESIRELFDKDRLTWQRIALGIVWFWGLFAIVRRYESVIIRRCGTFLLPLGTNSLYVYTIESFVVFFSHLLVAPAQPLVQLMPWYVNLILSMGAIALVWYATKKQFLFKLIPR